MTDADKRWRAARYATELANWKVSRSRREFINKAADFMLAYGSELEAAAIERCEKVYGWSLVRSILEQGAAIQQDYEAGKYPSYEHYSARVDEAARERADAIAKLREGK